MRNERGSQFQINAVAFKEGEAWVIQSIEYDIVAHASDVRAASYAFARAVVEHILITTHLGGNPLDGIKPAPERFHLMYQEADLEMRPLKNPKDAPEIVVRMAA